MNYYDINHFFSNSNIKTDPMYAPEEVLQVGQEVDDYICYQKKPTLELAINACKTYNKSGAKVFIDSLRKQLRFQHEYYRYWNIYSDIWIPVKSKLDVELKGKFVMDIKTTNATDRDQFMKTVNQLEYDQQLAVYAQQARVNAAYILVVSKKSDYCELLIFNSEQLAAGYQKFIDKIAALTLTKEELLNYGKGA